MSAASDQRAFPVRRRFPAGRVAPPAIALTVCAVVVVVSTALGEALPRIGGPIIALVLGMAIATLAPGGREVLAPIGRYALQAAIVLLGTTISLGEVTSVGGSSLPVMLGSLATSLLVASRMGRRLGVPERLRALVGIGTGICGASAIAATSGLVRARADEIRYAIATIFLFNLVAVIVFPIVGHALGMGPDAYGLWAGTAVNDTSSVVAAGLAYGHAAGTHALIVKLTRTTMIVPISLWLMARRTRGVQPADAGSAGPDRHAGTAAKRLRQIVPWFLVWFLAAAAADSLGAFGAGDREAFSGLGLVLTTVALAAVGLSSEVGELRRTGPRPLMLGALVWVAVSLASLALQALTGTA